MVVSFVLFALERLGVWGGFLRFYAFILLFSFFSVPSTLLHCSLSNDGREDEETRPGNTFVSFSDLSNNYTTPTWDAWSPMRSGIRMYTIPRWESFHICLLITFPVNVLSFMLLILSVSVSHVCESIARWLVGV